MSSAGEADAYVHAIARDWRTAPLPAVDRALCDFAVKLTHLAAEVDQPDVDALRAQGLDDAAISDAIQLVAYFNYVTRVADGVGIDDEPEWGASLT